LRKISKDLETILKFYALLAQFYNPQNFLTIQRLISVVNFKNILLA